MITCCEICRANMRAFQVEFRKNYERGALLKMSANGVAIPVPETDRKEFETLPIVDDEDFWGKEPVEPSLLEKHTQEVADAMARETEGLAAQFRRAYPDVPLERIEIIHQGNSIRVRERAVPDAEKEIVICAAVRFAGKVWRGHRHPHAMQAMRAELSYTMTRKQMDEAQVNKDQGFITSRNRFVGRKEALAIQRAAGIKSVERGEHYHPSDQLFSEDLY